MGQIVVFRRPQNHAFEKELRVGLVCYEYLHVGNEHTGAFAKLDLWDRVLSEVFGYDSPLTLLSKRWVLYKSEDLQNIPPELFHEREVFLRRMAPRCVNRGFFPGKGY